VHGYSATGAGAAFLPFTLILGVLSRWSGGLLNRFGARLPLIAGPAISALGLVLLAFPGASGRYWATFLLPMTVLGLGMAVTVAPLTTTVINAVASRQVGVASGINNAVASVASLLVIAVLGTVAIGALDHSLDRHLTTVAASAEMKLAVDNVRGGFVIPSALASIPGGTSDSPRADRRLLCRGYSIGNAHCGGAGICGCDV